jgi:hypothetical protein
MPIISLMVILENVIDWTMYKKGLRVFGVTNISGGNCTYKFPSLWLTRLHIVGYGWGYGYGV